MVAELSKRTMFTQVLDGSRLSAAEGSNPKVAVFIVYDKRFVLIIVRLSFVYAVYMDGVGSNSNYQYYLIAI